MPEGLLSNEFAWKREWVPRIRYYLSEEFMFTAVRDGEVQLLLRNERPHTAQFHFFGRQVDPALHDHVCVSIDLAYVQKHAYAVLDTAMVLQWPGAHADAGVYRAANPCTVDIESWDSKDPRVRERERRAEEARQAVLQDAAGPYTKQASEMTTQRMRKVRYIGEKTP